MKILKEIIEILSELKSLQNVQVDKFLFQENSDSFGLSIANETLVEIKEKSILVVGNDVTKKVFSILSSNSSDVIENNQIKIFFADLKDSLIRINHLGISYSCVNIEKEIVEIKKSLFGTSFKLYEEPNDSTNQRWFFVGNLENWENPLFEIVLTESEAKFCTKWIPHFQIDLDTNLSIKELESLTDKYFKNNFFDWKLDIPNYGVVMAMGELSNINGTKIFLGLGTNIRGTKKHREEILKLV
jgi:hypothetical protein